MRRRRFVVILFATFTATWMSATVVNRSGAHSGTDGDRSEPTRARYDSATITIRGELTAVAASALGPGQFILVALRGPDVGNCEDLGRQLRVLAAARPHLEMVISVEGQSAAAVTAFARRERLAARILPIAAEQVLASLPALPSPAVLLVEDLRITVGVAHPARFANIRLRSFQEELTILQGGEEPGFRNPFSENGT